MEQKKDKIVLHTCCAICSGYPISLLKDMGYQVIAYFYNPNIYPIEEYQKRLDAEISLCKHLGCELVVGDYETDLYYESVAGLENEPEKGIRCDKCFELRLLKTAKFAKENGIQYITTSMVISPHKNFQKLTSIGERIARDFDLNYLAIDFKKKSWIFENQ